MELKKIKRKFLISLFKENLREDKRNFFDYRELKIKVGVIENAEGSALVELGNTKVICGVKLEIMEPFPEKPDEGIIITNLDLTPLASKEIPPELIPIEAELGRVVDRGIRESGMVDLKKLVIEKEKFVWGVIIDIAVLNYDGNVIDASGIASYLALKNTFFPKIEKDGEKYKINYKEKTNEKLPLNKMVLPITFAKIENYLLVDPNKTENDLAEVIFTISRDENNIYSLQKSKDGVLYFRDIEKIIKISKQKFDELKEKINSKI